ncbi:MAG: type I restriction-modification system subunit M N-terminal domain-containing protein [Terrimicrobiaceae bacterium]
MLLRGTIDAGDYKQFIFPLLFFKRLCDVFDEEVRAALAESGGDEAFALFPENHRFQVPPEAHWREIRKVSRDVGRGLQQAILEVAKDTVEAEKMADPEDEQNQALAALTELFNEVKSKNTHVIVERIVTDIDAIVKSVRFPDWQNTSQGEREVRQVLRRTLLKYKLHTDQDLFEKSYGYIRQYY